MRVVHGDEVVTDLNGSEPNYDQSNPLHTLSDLIAQTNLAAEREHYLPKSIQYLFPFNQLTLYPKQDGQDIPPKDIDDKTDFQHQNIQQVKYGDTRLLRGWVNVNNTTVPFLRISYRGSEDSELSKQTGHQLSDRIKLWIMVNGKHLNKLINVPLNSHSNRFEIEIWGYPGDDLENHLDAKGKKSLHTGELIANSQLVPGNINDFSRNDIENQEICEISPDCCMHPILPLEIKIAWADHSEKFWDSNFSKNYRYSFNMIYRGWDNYLKVGLSENPHGGLGLLHFRTLFSNYWHYESEHTEQANLKRIVEPWMQDAFGNKSENRKTENFFKVDYMDLHILKPDSAIGLHRHRDNQEVFFMLEGEGLMVIGDWNEMDDRDRCIEIRTLRAGHMALLKGGNMHAVINTLNEPAMLFIFGGYD